MTDPSLRASLAAVVAALRGFADTVERLTLTLDDEQTSPVKTNDWPDLMSTSVAALYCGYKTSGGLRKAHLDKKVFPTGRRGGVGSWTWARADLDKFLRGRSPAADLRDDNTDPNVPDSEREPSPGQERKRRSSSKRRNSPHVEAALLRLKEMSRKSPR